VREEDKKRKLKKITYAITNKVGKKKEFQTCEKES